MKIALCLQGQPRCWRSGYNYLYKELLSKYDVDVFGHTWWDESLVGQYYNTAYCNPFAYLVEENLPENLNSVYQFKKLIVEKPFKFVPKRTYKVSEEHDKIYHNLMARTYSLKRVFDALKEYEKEKHIDYDFAIMSRYDIGIFSSLPNFKELDKNKIYVANYHIERKYVFNDNFWILGKYNKYILKSIHDDFDRNYDLTQEMNEKYKEKLKNTELLSVKYLSGELMFAFHLLYNGFNLDDVIKHPNINTNLIRQ